MTLNLLQILEIDLPENRSEMKQIVAKFISLLFIMQVVKMNPYAALCSQMLSQAIHKLKTGEDD